MDLQQAKIVLNKINALFKNLSIDEGNIASIEKELMLNYIRQFYESFLDMDAPASPGKKSKKSAPKKQEEPEFEVVEPKEEPKPKKKEYVPPKIIEIPDSLKELTTEEPPPPAPKPKPKPKPAPKPEPVVQTPPPTPKPTTSANAVNIDSLLQHKEAKELSEKLSERPIQDLSKALSINDRLLYINELFGKNQNALNDALTHLNQYTRMNEAVPYLSELAGQYDWLDKEKKDTAISFIKIVRRRYN